MTGISATKNTRPYCPALQHVSTPLLEAIGVTIVFSGLKKQVLDIMRQTELAAEIGDKNIFANENMALRSIYQRLEASGVDTSDDLSLITAK